MSDQLRRIQASSIDGRAQNPRYAQGQLRALFEILVENKASVKAALRSDTSYTPAEVETEYYLTLATIRQHYSSISLPKALEDEYSIANSKDQLQRRPPVGSVYIVPERHSPLYATVAPLSTAIAAGNCVVIELKQTLSELNSLLRRILTASLDRTTFVVLDTTPVDDEFFSSSVTVHGSDISEGFPSSLKQVSCPSSSRVVAVIDRTANIRDAAKEIVHSRFGFGGHSPYAPDLVLVNEYALKEFCTAVVQMASTYFANQVETANGFAHKATVKNSGLDELNKSLAEDGIETLISASRGTISLVKNRTSSLLTQKISQPVLLIVPTTSLDDAIDTSSSTTSSLLATYIFAAPTSAKYLSQFIPASLSSINSIPPSLLIGPASPTGYTPSLSPYSRFTVEMFTRPAPEFISPHPEAKSIEKVLYGGEKGAEVLCTETLPSSDQPKGGQVGFFEQGLFTGGGILLTSILGTVGLVGYYVGPAVVRKLR